MAGRAAPGGRRRGDRARGRAELGHLPAEHHRPQRAGRAGAALTLAGRRGPAAARSRRSRWRTSSTRSRTAPRVLRRAILRKEQTDRQPRRPPGRRRRPPDACGAGPPRRGADRLHVRPDRGRGVPRALPGGDPEHQDPAAAMVGRPRRAGRRASPPRSPAGGDRRGPPSARGSPAPQCSATCGAAGWSRAPTTTSRRLAALSRWPRCSATARSRACVCGLSRPAPRRRSRTGSGRFMASHRYELPPEPTYFVNLDTVGLAAADPARGRGAGLDGALRRGLSRSRLRPRRSATASSSSAASAPGRRPTR